MDKRSVVAPGVRWLPVPFLDGERLASALEASEGFGLDAALWLYEAEDDRWRYVIATPLFDTAGPRAVLKRVQDVIGDEPAPFDADLSTISPVSAKSRIVKAIKSTYHVRTGDTPVFLKMTRIADVYISEALVYRA